MSIRPYVLLSVAASLDGCIDDTGASRLLLSNQQDFDRVDGVRARADAILVGANTIRTDNPRLLVRSAQRRQERLAQGRPATPVKVTVTSSGDLEPEADFFTTGDSDKLVYTTTGAVRSVQRRLTRVATVVDAGDPLDVHRVLADLTDRKIETLMVEGGSTINTLFLTAGVVDELQLVFAPFFVGETEAPRLVSPAAFPRGLTHQLTLSEVHQIGEVVLLRYLARSDPA